MDLSGAEKHGWSDLETGAQRLFLPSGRPQGPPQNQVETGNRCFEEGSVHILPSSW